VLRDQNAYNSVSSTILTKPSRFIRHLPQTMTDERSLRVALVPIAIFVTAVVFFLVLFFVNEVLGGLSRITFQMGVSALPHQKMLRSIELLGTRVAPNVRKQLTTVLS